MTTIIVSTAALAVAALTLFSGFGLGTLLMPVFALFFPVEVAVAATAVVHLANNLFKLTLIGKWAAWSVVARFAPTAALFAIVGALLLNRVSTSEPLVRYTLAGRACEVTTVKFVIAGLIAAFTILELVPALEGLSLDKKYLPLGGALSGFFGGLSGHQGALRTAFLVRAGLGKEAFLGTIVVCAVAVDISRLLVYGSTFFARDFAVLNAQGGTRLVIAATLSAFVGSFLGSKLVKKVALPTVHRLVGIMLLVLAGALGTGLI
jgi:uncharacterized membrane protein YfcA